MARHEWDDESNFDLALLGYNRRQVDHHLDELEQRMDDAAVAFDAAITLQNELNAAHAEIRRLRRARLEFPDGRELGDQITRILQTAEEQAAAIRAQAERDARTMRRPAGNHPIAA